MPPKYPLLFLTWYRHFWPALPGLLALVVLLLGVNAHAQVTISSSNEDSRYGGEFLIPINKSRILQVSTPYNDLLIGNAEIADVVPLTDRSVYVLGKTLGSTSLSIYGPNRRLIAVADIVVTHDLDGVERRLGELVPGSGISVHSANESLVLSGTAQSSQELDQALQVAERYAPGQVTNLVSVNGSQQVMLAVRFAEMQRVAARELGISRFNFGNISGNSVDVADSTVGSNSILAAVGLTGLPLFEGGISILADSFQLDSVFDALEEEGIVRTLAEPNLIAMSGEPASFLAGGEFPIPVAQDSNAGGQTITIEFKSFGVSLAFTPTVLSNQMISLVVEPEVSAIDPNTSITANGLVIPGLTTRRASTVVELGNGQSFAIAGLLQSDFTDGIDSLPGIGDIPILGALFRSTSYRQNETELVIIVTPYLVKSSTPGQLAVPTDNFNPPSQGDLFLSGRVEAPGSPYAANPVGSVPQVLSGQPQPVPLTPVTPLAANEPLLGGGATAPGVQPVVQPASQPAPQPPSNLPTPQPVINPSPVVTPQPSNGYGGNYGIVIQ